MEKVTLDIKEFLLKLDYEMDDQIESLLGRIESRREVSET